MIKLNPSLDDTVAFMQNDFNVVKLRTFYSREGFDDIRYILLYAKPIYKDGLIVNPPEDRGPALGERSSYLFSSWNENLKSALYSNSVSDPNVVDKERTIYALIVVNKDNLVVGDYEDTMVLEFKRPIVLKPTDKLGYHQTRLNIFEGTNIFQITSYNELLNKQERIYGWLTAYNQLSYGQVACGRLSNANPTTPAQELAWIKDRAESVGSSVPVFAINGRLYNLLYQLDTSMSYTEDRKVYQLQGKMTIPTTVPEVPRGIIAKPAATYPQAFDKSLTWVFINFDGFARGSTIDLSLSLGLS